MEKVTCEEIKMEKSLKDIITELERIHNIVEWHDEDGISDWFESVIEDLRNHLSESGLAGC